MTTTNPSKHTSSSKSSRKRSAHKVHTLPLATMAALLTAATCLGSQPAMAVTARTPISTPTYTATAKRLTNGTGAVYQDREADVVVNNPEWLKTPSILEFQRYRSTNDESKDKKTFNSNDYGSDEYNTLIKKTDMYAHIETIDGAKYLVFDVFFNNDAQSMVNLSNRQWYIWQVPYQIAKLKSDGSFENDTIRDLRFDAYKLKDASQNDKIKRKMNFTLSRDFAKFEKVDNQSTTINFPNDHEKNFGGNRKNSSSFHYSLGPNLVSDKKYETDMSNLFHENHDDYAIGKATYPEFPYSGKNYGIGIQTSEVNLAFHMHAAVKLNDTAINENATTYDKKYANIHNAWTWADSATYGRTTSSSYVWLSGRDPESENDKKLQRHKDDSIAPKIYHNGTEITDDNQTIQLKEGDTLSFTTTDNKGYIEKFSISGLTDTPTTKQGVGSESKPLSSDEITVTKKMNGKKVTVTSEDGSGNVTTRKVKVKVTTLAKEHPLTGKTINTTVGEPLPPLTEIDKFVEIKDGDKLEKKPTLEWNGLPTPNTDTVGVFTHSIKGTYSDKSTGIAKTKVTINVKPQKPVIDTDLANLAGKKGQKVTVSVGSGIPEGTTTTVKLFDKNNNEIGSTTTIKNGKAEITVNGEIPAGDVYATTTVTKPEKKDGPKGTIPGFDLTSEKSDKKQATAPKDTQNPTITATADSSSVTVGQDLKIHIVAKDDVNVKEVNTLQALMSANLLQATDITSGRACVSKTTDTDQEQVLDLTVKNMQPKEVGTHTLTFTVTDSAGKTGSTTLTITVKPAVSGQKAENKTGKDKTTVSGKTTPGAKVTISKDGQKVGEVTAENDGSFTVDIDKQTPNTTLTLTPSKNGVNGDPVTTTVTDETPAEKPAVSGQKAENKTGKDKTTVSGKTTPGAKVTISKDGQKVGEVTAENDGSFTVDIDKQTPNTTLTLTPSKNGVNGDPVTTTVTDETPAEKPAVSGQKAENKTGKDKTTVSGKTTPGAKVTISKDGQKVGEVTAENDGSFTVDIDKQTPNTTLTLTPSKNGVNGDPVTTTVTDETPAEKPAVSGQKAENKTGKDKTTVSGKTTPGAKVTISKDGQKVGEVTAENDGSFTVDIDKQTPNTTLTLTPSKNGVNGDPVTTTVTDETPAEKPAVSGQKAENKTGKDKTTVSGKTTPGAKVTISKDGQKVGEVTAENDGSFTVDIDKQTPNTTLTLTPSKNGVNGDPVTTTVTDETPAEKPAAPTVTTPTSGNDQGSATITPATGTDTLEITYTPENETTPKTITVKKGNDNKWKIDGNTPDGVTVNETTGEVTIPANKVKDNSDVTAKNSKNGTNSDEKTGQTGTNNGNSGSGSGSGTGSDSGSGSETGNSNSSESDSGNDSTSNNGGSDSGSTTGGSSSTDSGAQNSTNKSSSTDNANNAGNAETGNAETGNAETGNAGNGKAGNASTGASGSNASAKSGNKAPAKHSSQLVNTGAEVERVGLISAMISVLGAAAAFFSRKKNRE